MSKSLKEMVSGIQDQNESMSRVPSPLGENEVLSHSKVKSKSESDAEGEDEEEEEEPKKKKEPKEKKGL